MMKKLSSILLIITLTTTLLCACSNNSTSDFPQGDLEIYVPGSAGGGSDVFARNIASIAMKNNLFPNNVTIINKPGGSGSVCYGLVAGQPADGYVLATVSSSFFTGPITGQSPVSPEDFTTVAGLAEDPLLLLVKQNSPFNSFKELADYAKSNPGKLTCAGSSGHSADRIAYEAIKSKEGLEMNFIPFGSGAEALTQVLGGHIDFCFSNPSECISQIEGSLMKPLVVTLDERFELLPDVPTLIEEGTDFTLSEFRAVVGPKDMPEEIVKYYSDIFKKLSESKEWEDGYIKTSFLQSNYLNYIQAGEKINELNQMYKEMIENIGDL